MTSGKGIKVAVSALGLAPGVTTTGVAVGKKTSVAEGVAVPDNGTVAVGEDVAVAACVVDVDVGVARSEVPVGVMVPVSVIVPVTWDVDVTVAVSVVC